MKLPEPATIANLPRSAQQQQETKSPRLIQMQFDEANLNYESKVLRREPMGHVVKRASQPVQPDSVDVTAEDNELSKGN